MVFTGSLSLHFKRSFHFSPWTLLHVFPNPVWEQDKAGRWSLTPVLGAVLKDTEITGLCLLYASHCFPQQFSLARCQAKGGTLIPKSWFSIPVVLKLFHVKDPQIDTYQPTDPYLKRYA